MGWCARRRDFGPLTFIDLRDRDGITQIVVNQENAPEAHAKAKDVRGEYVLAVIGEVVLRDETARNPKLATGEVEVQATEIRILNDARTLPFQLDASETALAAEDLRLKYRYLDLRRPQLQSNLRLAPSSAFGNQSVHGRTGLHRNRNADPDQIHARRRARLHRAVARAAREVLCFAAIAADS